MHILQQTTGINPVFNFGGIIYQSVLGKGIISLLILSGANMFSTIPALFLFDRLGRRNLLIFGGLGMAVGHFLAATVFVTGCDVIKTIINGTIVNEETVSCQTSSGILMLFFTAIFVCFFALSWGPVAWIYAAEIFPLNIRARAVAITTGSNWFLCMVMAYVLELITPLGIHGVFYLFGGLCLFSAYSSSPNDPPGQKPQIIFGNLFNSGLLTGRKTGPELFTEYQQAYGDVFLFWVGPQKSPVFCLPEHAQTIFSDRHTFDQSPLFIPNFDLLCPNGIITLSGLKWKRHARVMLPMFKRAKIVHYSETILHCTDQFIDKHLDDNHIYKDLTLRCQSLLMNIIAFIAFDHDLEAQIDSSCARALQDFVYYASQFMIAAWLPRWLGKLYLKLNWKYQRAHRILRELSEQIVEQEQNKHNDCESQRPKNLIASLVSSLNEQANDQQISSGLTQAEIFDEVLMAITAGTETTAKALSWFMFYMSKHPRVQQKIKQELKEHDLAVGDNAHSSSLSMETLDSLVYCDCVTKEVLRLAPVAGLTARRATRDTVVDDISIHRGQDLYIALYNMNKDPRYWHHGDPTEFIPERFLFEDKNHHPYAMVTFGGGHRACLGQDLAQFELKLMIIRLMQRGVSFEDTPENIGGYKQQVTCCPRHLVVRVRIDHH
ncbi:unnamed protein product [Rotaria sp. Silwood1]|nr:unnamed protein product [Rotaria sp. Silwood1]